MSDEQERPFPEQPEEETPQPKQRPEEEEFGTVSLLDLMADASAETPETIVLGPDKRPQPKPQTQDEDDQAEDTAVPPTDEPASTTQPDDDQHTLTIELPGPDDEDTATTQVAPLAGPNAGGLIVRRSF